MDANLCAKAFKRLSAQRQGGGRVTRMADAGCRCDREGPGEQGKVGVQVRWGAQHIHELRPAFRRLDDSPSFGSDQRVGDLDREDVRRQKFRHAAAESVAEPDGFVRVGL